MQPHPLRSAGSRGNGNLSSPRGGRYRLNTTNADLPGRREGRDSQKIYMDLDRAYLSRGRASSPKTNAREHPRRRTAPKPESLLAENNSSFAFKKLPGVEKPATEAAEESILKKWEAWSSQMGTQLALQNTVPVVPATRSASRNSSFRSMSQLSNSSLPRQRPESARGLSPMRAPSRRSASFCSSRSRQSSLASTVVEPFRVGDRMTASAERKRHRPQSTKGSRELLFRRALGLEEGNSERNDSFAGSAVGRSAPVPAPLVDVSRLAVTAENFDSTRPSKPTELQIGAAMPSDARETIREGLQTRNAAVEKEADTAASKNTADHKKRPGDGQVFAPATAEKRDDCRAAEWLKKSAALLSQKDAPFAAPQDKGATMQREDVSAKMPVTEKAATPEVREKWHLPLGEAAQMVCGRVRVHRIHGYTLPSIGYRDEITAQTVDVQDDSTSLRIARGHSAATWSLDRADVKVLFVDRPMEEGQMTAYGVELPTREVMPPDVLPDWDESRRRFAPAPIPDEQKPK